MPSDEGENPGTQAGARRPGAEVSQSELDALIAAFEEKERRAQGPAAASPPLETLDPIPQSTAKPIPVASLMLNANTSSDMEALIRQAAGPSQPPSADPLDEDVEGAIERLTAAAAGDLAAAADVLEVPRAAPPAPDFEAAPEEDLLDRPLPVSQLPDLEGVFEEESTAGNIEASGDDAHDATDATDAPIASVDDEDQDISVAKADAMDEVLAVVADSDPGAAATEATPAPNAEQRAPKATAAEIDSVTKTTVIEDIGSENIAAGAAPEILAPAPSPVPKPAAASKAAAAAAIPAPEAAPPRKRWLPPSFLSLAREEPVRTFVAAGAGLLAAGIAFALLSANQLRPAVQPSGDPRAQMPLERAVRTAEALIEEKDYQAAASLLGAVLGRTKGDSAAIIDAKFLHVHAMYLAAPEQLTAADADPLHEAIDDAIASGHQHPKTAEALTWKAGVYERQGNVAAARAELRGILDNYASAPNRDAVILALADLELRSGRRAEATDAADRLLKEFPNSPLSGRARIVQGDAYAMGGNNKPARAAFLLAAAERADAAAGTEALERLGKLALDAGHPEAAIEELLKRLDSSTSVKGNDVVYLVLARAYRAAKQPEKARNVLNELVDFFPDSKVIPDAMVELSQVLDDLGLRTEAGRLADRAAQRYPTHPGVLRRAGQLLAERGEPAGAAKLLLAAYDAGAHEPAVLLSAAEFQLKAGDAASAQSTYGRLIEEHGGAAEALDAKIGWARAARDQGRLEEAFTRLADLSRANEGGPKQLTVLRALADLYGELGLEGELVQTYGKVAAVTKEAAPLAEAAERLIEAGAEDEGLQIAERVEVARLDPARGYSFLLAWGRSLLHKDADEALKVLVRGHDQYPAQRSAEGVETVLRAALTLGRGAQARALVADLQARAAAAPANADAREWFEHAAVQYGDFLFRRRDFTQAADVYAMLARPAAPKNEVASAPERAEESEAQRWSVYQRANSLYATGNLLECLPIFDAVGKSASPYAGDAKARADLVRYELRRRGESEPEAKPKTPAKAAL